MQSILYPGGIPLWRNIVFIQWVGTDHLCNHRHCHRLWLHLQRRQRDPRPRDSIRIQLPRRRRSDTHRRIRHPLRPVAVIPLRILRRRTQHHQSIRSRRHPRNHPRHRHRRLRTLKKLVAQPTRTRLHRDLPQHPTPDPAPLLVPNHPRTPKRARGIHLLRRLLSQQQRLLPAMDDTTQRLLAMGDPVRRRPQEPRFSPSNSS